jgi:hypothetical protein
VTGPRRPRNIVRAIRSFPSAEKPPDRLTGASGRPIERPTVPKAEVTSKSTGSSARRSWYSNTSAIPLTSRNESSVTLKALVTFSSVRRRWKTRTSGRPVSAVQTESASVPAVVVFTPPPVLPGEAPTNISRTNANRVTSVRAPIPTVLNPAVRAVADWKKAARSRSAGESSAIGPGCPDSPARITRVPARRRTPVTVTTSLAWRDHGPRRRAPPSRSSTSAMTE